MLEVLCIVDDCCNNYHYLEPPRLHGTSACLVHLVCGEGTLHARGEDAIAAAVLRLQAGVCAAPATRAGVLISERRRVMGGDRKIEQRMQMNFFWSNNPVVYCEKWEDRFGFIYLQRVIRGRNGRLQWSVITHITVITLMASHRTCFFDLFGKLCNQISLIYK